MALQAQQAQAQANTSSATTTTVRGARRMLPDQDWKAGDQPGVIARTSGGNKDMDNDDNEGGDIPSWMFKWSNQKTEKSAPKQRDSKKKPAQPRKMMTVLDGM